MDRNPQTPYPGDDEAYHPASELPADPPAPHASELAAKPVVESAPSNPRPYDPPAPAHRVQYQEPQYEDYSAAAKPPPLRPDSNDVLMQNQQQPYNPYSLKNLSPEWRRKLMWLAPIGLIVIVLVVLFEVYKSDFERWVQPLANWLRERESWSWVIPVSILFLLSFPPLFGHEIVQIVVGLTYPLGVALGIACAGSILGEAGCFIVFKYFFTGYVDKKIASSTLWAVIARVAKKAGYRGVLVIRYSIVPPHLANPLFACTGMKFWVYMTTVILSLPKAVIFVALGSPGSEHSKGAKWAKVVAVGIVVAISVFASIWIRKQMIIANEEIMNERGITAEQGQAQGPGVPPHQDEEYEMLGNEEVDTEYRGATQQPYDPVRAK